MRPFAWVSLDEGDDDPVTLLQHVAAALDRVEPLPASALEPLTPDRRPAPARALQRLGTAIGARHAPFVLVLDGADLLSGDSIAALGTLVGHIPAGSMIVLAGRVVPELPVAALRAGGPLLELGPYELALSRREAELLLRAARLELEDDEINELVERTEGWAAGLYLTALAARAEGDEQPDVRSVTGADRYLADYFRSEYLSRLAPERLTFLRRSSVLETMSGPLCDAVLERRARRSSWPRWSRRACSSFRSTGTAAPTATTISSATCCARSSRTASRSSCRCSTSGRRTGSRPRATTRPTLDYSHAAGNEASAARILSSIAMPVSASGRVASVESWLDRFDDEALQRHPEVAVEGLADPRPARAAGRGRGLAGGSRARCAGEERKGRGHEGLHGRRPRRDVRRGAREHARSGRRRRSGSSRTSIRGARGRWS